MEVTEAIKGRRSIRRYKDTDVTAEQVEQILQAGQLAPSAGNLQGREFIIVRDQQTRHRIADAAHRQRFIEEAPVCIVVCTNLPRTARNYGKRAELYVVQDTATSVMNMMLQACDLGLGTCWIGAFDERSVAEILGVPGEIRPVAILPVGVPDEAPEARPRLGKNVEHYEHW